LGRMISQIKKGRFFTVSGGHARKSMVLADDVARNILRISENSGIYHLTDGLDPEVGELSAAIAKQFGVRRIINVPYRIASVLAFCGDLFGAKSVFNSSILDQITSSLTFSDFKARANGIWESRSVVDQCKYWVE
jgi:nucleoside-diphosphate-sugar epimerase